MQRNAWRQLWFMQGIPQWTVWSQHGYLQPPFISPCLVGVPDLWCFMTLWPYDLLSLATRWHPRGSHCFWMELTLQGFFEPITHCGLVIPYNISHHGSRPNIQSGNDGFVPDSNMYIPSLESMWTFCHWDFQEQFSFSEIWIKRENGICKILKWLIINICYQTCFDDMNTLPVPIFHAVILRKCIIYFCFTSCIFCMAHDWHYLLLKLHSNKILLLKPSIMNTNFLKLIIINII